ncbi:MAG: hypothetical protein LEGION0403_FIIPPAGN_02330 [Legionella sp.]|uniref:hypothetical protein n=1 Tax=Legionella sp. TaxID=459 RepID=UPI003D11AD14
MAQPEFNAKEYWFFLRFFYWAYSTVSSWCSWLFIEQFQLPDDASGELMRRTLAKKSWFDEICSGWVEKSLWFKLQAVLGISFAAGVVGIFVGASMLLALTALFITVSAHILMVSHEHHRYQAVTLMAKETIELNQALLTEQQSLVENAQIVKDTSEQLTQKKGRIQAHLDRLQQTVAEISEQQSQLDVPEEKVLEAEKSLEELKQGSEYIKKAQESQKVDAFYLQNFSVFMEQQRRENSQEADSSFNLEELKDELEEGMALMDEMKKGMR